MEFRGTNGADTLTGTSAADTLIGLEGDDSLNGGAGYDTYVFGPGFGSDFINDDTNGASGGQIVFEAGITAADVTLVRDPGNVRDVLVQVGTDVIRIDNFYDSNGNIVAPIDTISFSGSGEFIDLYSAEVPIIGTNGADTLTGTSAADTLIGLEGDDLLNGGAGYDTYVFGPGFGSDFINDDTNGASGGQIVFEAGITAADVTLVRDPGNVRDVLVQVGADVIRIDNFYDSNGNIVAPIDTISFSGSGEFIDLYSAEVPIIGTNGADTLTGTDAADTLIGLAGDDSLNGGAGYDTYVFGSGFGSDFINDDTNGASGGQIVFEAGITAADVTLVRDPGNVRDVLVQVGADVIRIDNFYDSNGNIVAPIDTISFSGTGEFIDLYSAEVPIIGTNGADTLTGTDAADTLIGLAGDDSLNGGAGYDTYVFGSGFGSDFINDDTNGASGGQIVFEAGITAADVTLVRDPGNVRDVLVQVGADVIRIDNFYDSNGNIVAPIDTISFSGTGEFIDLYSAEVPIIGTNGADTLTGTSAADTLIGLEGDDSLNGGAGYDTYVFGPGFGSDFINDDTNGASGGQIVFEAGITAADVTYAVAPDNPRDLLIQVGDNSIRVDNFYNADGSILAPISLIGFDGGTEYVDISDPSGPAGNAEPLPQDLEIAIDMGPQLAPGQVGTLALVVTGIDAEALADASGPQTYLVALSADQGLVADTLNGGFSPNSYVLVTIDPASPPTSENPLRIEVPYRGSAGPNTSVSVSAALATQALASEIVTRITDSAPAFLEDGFTTRLAANLEQVFGTNVEDLTAALAGFAARFDSFELNADSATAALGFAVDVAGDFGTLESRSYEGAFGQGWLSLADIGLQIDGEMLRLTGLSDIGALETLSLVGSAVYGVSNSTGRSVSLGGATFAVAAPIMPRFEEQLDGQFTASNGFEGTLSRTADGFRVDFPDGSVMRFDADGVFLALELPNGEAITAIHDDQMRIIGLNGPDGNSLTFTRDDTGLVTAVTDESGQSMTLTYNPEGQLVGTDRPAGTAAFAYDAQGDLVQATAPGGIVSTFSYDAFGRLVAGDYGGGLLTENFVYDGVGGFTRTDGNGNSVEVVLLPGGAIARTTDGSGNAAELVFDENGALTGVEAPDGTLTEFEFDDLGRLTKITDATGAELTFTYEGDSEQPTSFTDAGGNTRTFAYDDAGQILSASWPDGTQLQFDYDASGNLVGYTNRRGEEVSYSYDASGNLLTESDSSAGATSYVYDALDRLVSATSDQGTTTLTYDDANRVTQIIYPDGQSLSFTYNAAGQRASITDGGDYTVFYDYDALGRLVGLRDETSLLVSYEYDAAGNLVREENGNGTATNYEYDESGRLIRIENLAPDGAVSSFFAYTYDAAGQRVAMQTADGDWVYGYDAIGQLTSASFTSANPDIEDTAITYEYDAAGNRTLVVQDGVETLYVANELNQYVQVGDATFTYDDDGNMVTRTDPDGTTTYRYDVENRLIGITEPDGTVISFEYDIFGNRTAKTVDGVETEYLVDPFGLGNVLTESVNGAVAASYVHGLGLAAGEVGGTATYYEADAVGSITAVTAADGEVANSYVYDPYGGELFESETLANDFEFNGALGVMEDTEDLDYMRARTYSEELGRFLSEDPLWLSGDTQNLYRAVNNGPTNLVDPSGEFWGQVITAGVLAYFGYTVYGEFEEREQRYSELDIVNDPAAYAEARREDLAGAGNIANEALGLPGTVPPTPKIIDAIGLAGDLLDEALSENPASTSAVGDNTTGPADNSGANDGDPHISTFDGVGYSFQAVGEFILAQGDGFQIQTRMEAINDFVSVNTATVMNIGDDVVGIYAREDVPLVINGTPVVLERGETIAVGDGTVYRGFFGASDELGVFDVYVVSDGNGNGFWVNVYFGANHLRPFVADGQNISGLMGNADGVAENDFMLRDGTVLAQPLPAEVLYGVFGDSWRITQDESLFEYEDGSNTDTFTDPNFPTDVVTLEDLDPAAVAAAEQAALDAGLVPGTFEFETTVLDIAITGDPIFAQGVGGAPDFQEPTDPVEVTPAEVVDDLPGVNIIIGTENLDVLPGSEGVDSIFGLEGDDRIDGLAGDDTIFGADGNDGLKGGDGHDMLVGGNGNDRLPAGEGNDTSMGGEGNDRLGGGNGDDYMDGGPGNDGGGAGPGNDTVIGGAGDDRFNGGYGADEIILGEGNDTSGGSFGNDTMNGGAGDDYLGGGNGNDSILGGAGADTIISGYGDDTVTGGTGADTFVFNSLFGGDTTVITDFEDGIDTIRVIGLRNPADPVARLDITDTTYEGQAAVEMTYGNHTIVVVGATMSEFSESDFLFS